MKITLDTNFLISATIWDYSESHKLLKKLLTTNAELFTSKQIMQEFAEVLIRDFQYKNEEIETLINSLMSSIKSIETTDNINFIKEDPDDDKILECAVSSSSEYIITYDNHLLKLKEYNGIKIIKPEDFP